MSTYACEGGFLLATVYSPEESESLDGLLEDDERAAAATAAAAAAAGAAGDLAVAAEGGSATE